MRVFAGMTTVKIAFAESRCILSTARRADIIGKARLRRDCLLDTDIRQFDGRVNVLKELGYIHCSIQDPVNFYAVFVSIKKD
jgi:hypothetical protein